MENWKDVKGYEGIYQVSSFGRIRNIKTGRMSSTKEIKTYRGMHFYKDGEVKRDNFHRVVATSFIPNPENKPEINHINGIKHDNRVENLEWCTANENVSHSYKFLKRKKATGHLGKIGFDNHTSKSVLQISLDGFILNEFGSMCQASKETGISDSNIGQCVRGKRKQTGGYLWM